MKIRIILCVTMLSLIAGHHVLLAGQMAQLDEEARTIAKTMLSIGDQLGTDDITYLQNQINSSIYPLQALASLLLYKYDSSAYEQHIFDNFSIHDYVERFQGNYHMISQEEFLDDIATIESGSNERTDKFLDVLLMYCHYRELNTWISKGKQRISLARFFRTAFMTIILGDERALWLANTIDRATEEADLLEYTQSEAFVTHIHDMLQTEGDVNKRYGNGYTLLFYAAKAGNKEATEVLLSNGVNINIKANNGKTALMLAKESHHHEIVQMLEEAGATE